MYNYIARVEGGGASRISENYGVFSREHDFKPPSPLGCPWKIFLAFKNNFPKWRSHITVFSAIFGLFQPFSAKLGYLCQFFMDFEIVTTLEII